MSLWNTTFDNTTDWSAASFLNMFVSAYTERANGIGVVYGGGAPPAIASVNVGDDVQKGGFVVFSPSLSGFIGKLQGNAVGLATTYFLDPATARNGQTPTSTGNYSMGQMNVYSQVSLFTKIGGDTRGYWRRKRPREITSLSATTDIQSNAAGTGQLAWGTGTNSSSFHVGGLYQYSGSAWVEVSPTMGPPDLLDSHAAAPNTVHITDAEGLILAGDYIGPWLFNELRDVFNAMVWIWLDRVTERGGSPGSGNEHLDAPSFYKTGTAGASTYASALATAQANYAGATPTSQVFPTFGVTTSGTYGGVVAIAYSGANYSVTIERTQLQLITKNLSTTIAHAVDFYVAVRPPTYAPGGGTIETFDDQGTGAANQKWYLFNTVGPTTNASDSSTIFDPIATVPPDDPPSAAVVANLPNWVVYGHNIYATTAIARYDVTGGFAWTIST